MAGRGWQVLGRGAGVALAGALACAPVVSPRLTRTVQCAQPLASAAAPAPVPVGAMAGRYRLRMAPDSGDARWRVDTASLELWPDRGGRELAGRSSLTSRLFPGLEFVGLEPSDSGGVFTVPRTQPRLLVLGTQLKGRSAVLLVPHGASRSAFWGRWTATWWEPGQGRRAAQGAFCAERRPRT